MLFIVYFLSGIDDALNSDADGNGVIALAHPSSIAIGQLMICGVTRQY